MSLSTDCRIAALVAFSQARAMGTGTNAGGGAVTGAADCGRDPDGRFGGGNKCRWSGSTPDGTWEIEDNTSGTTMRIDAEPAPHVLRLKGNDGNVKAFMHATVIDDASPMKLHVDYSQVIDEEQGKGVYTNLLNSLSEQFTVLSDTPPNLAIPAAKAYKKLGAEKQWDDSYILHKKSGRSTRAFCPTGSGGGVDNSCGISNSKGERIRNVRTKSDKMQTKVARKLYQMRTTEKQIKKLIRDLGGKVSNSIVEIESTRGEEGVNIFIRDRDNNETHFIHMGYYGAAIYTSDKVSNDEAKRIRAVSEEAFPKTIDKRLYGRGKKYNIDVVNDPTQTKTAWDGLSSKQRFKAKLDARYASLLAFAESRDCGRDEDGKFSSGNTCGSGVAAAAATGAVKGAVKGAITGLLTGGPAVVKPAAAIGAATGAVKGIYDNQMRPTRVKKTIERLGMDTKQVGELVEKLGGTPESSADTKGGSLRLTIKDKEGKKTFSVEVDKKTITVYPRRATGELTTKEISRVKEIADKSTPKSISVVVKKSSSAYVSKLVRNGFTVAAGNAGDILVATYLTAPVHSFAHDAVQSVKKTFSRR